MNTVSDEYLFAVIADGGAAESQPAFFCRYIDNNMHAHNLTIFLVSYPVLLQAPWPLVLPSLPFVFEDGDLTFRARGGSVNCFVCRFTLRHSQKL